MVGGLDAFQGRPDQDGLVESSSSCGYHPGVSTVRWLRAHEQATWQAFLHASLSLMHQLDRELQRDAGIPHAYYMILGVLSEAPERRLRMSELAATLWSSPSRLSHAVARLEERAWIQRVACVTDKRGAIAVLTEPGLQALSAAAPGHVEGVRRHLFDQLTPE